MKNIFYKIAITVLALSMMYSCNDRVETVFTDYYVCIKDENGAETSSVDASVSNLTVTYYVYLVAPVLDHNVVVNYEFIPGAGLQEGVDYTPVSSSRSVTIAKGITRMPIRVTYNKSTLDPDMDNTLTIRLTSCSNESLNLGYPGPAARFRSHTVTKR